MWIHHVDPRTLVSMLTVFLILAILAPITESVRSAEGQPDWTKCKSEATCFCDKAGLLSQELADTLAGDCAKAGAQNRFLSGDSALIQMQISEPGIGSTLILRRMNKDLFGCKFNSVTKKVELVGDKLLLKKHRMVLFEDRSRFVDGFSLCAIKAERMTLLFAHVQNRAIYSTNREQSMQLTIGGSPKDFLFDGATYFALFKHDADLFKCNPYSFEDKAYLDDYHVLPIMNRDQDKLNCNDEYGPSYKLRYEFGDKSGEIPELECFKDERVPSNVKFYYRFDEGKLDETSGQPLPPTVIADTEKYTFFCAAPMGEVCPAPDLGCTPGQPDCPSYGKDPGKAATLTCIADRLMNQNQPAFFFVSKSGIEKKVTPGARCFSDYDCNITRPISLEASMSFADGTVKCTDPTIDLTIYAPEENVTSTAKSFGCDKADGLWKNSSSGTLKELIPAGSQLTCPKKSTAFGQIAEAKFSPGMIIGIIIGSSIGALGVMVAIAFGVLYYKKHRRVRTLDKKDLRKMDREARIKHFQDFFPKVLNTTTMTIHHIVDGLLELDVLLDMEIEDPDVWDTIYPFLMRVQGAISRIDSSCSHMLSRYLYLQAKKIIDKHGWLSATRIRKSTPDGLIRVVAIKLLSFAISDRTCPEAEKLMLQGFRKLGFRGTKQYPHCGVMWSVITHARPVKTRNKAKPERVRSFNYRRLSDQLYKIAFKRKSSIPPDEIIPNFGTVQLQAAYANGTWQSVGYHIDHNDDMLGKKMDGGALALAYYAGCIGSLTRCPAQTVLTMLAQFPKANQKVLESLWKVAPKEEWEKRLEVAYRIATFYGRHLDANRMEERLVTHTEVPGPAIVQLQQTQQDFEAALEKQLEELREWTGEHTDKEEFKQKPAYNVSAKFEQAMRNATAKDKADGGPTVSNSGGAASGKSQSDGSSGSKNPPASASENPAPVPATPATPST